jgi:hypothetical protein
MPSISTDTATSNVTASTEVAAKAPKAVARQVALKLPKTVADNAPAKARKSVGPNVAPKNKGTVKVAPNVKAQRPTSPAAPVTTRAAPLGKAKPKLVRDSFTMPKAEYAAIDALKHRAGQLARQVKKSELLRAGVMALTAMDDQAFVAALVAVPTIKTGRPHKG